MADSPSRTTDREIDIDAALMLKVGRGDDAALAMLIERWKTPLINFFYRSLGSYEEAEELAMTVFVRVHRAAPRYRPTAKFSTYLFQIARRLLINAYRKHQRKPLQLVDPAELHAVDSDDSVMRSMEIEESFHHALAGLPENQRTALLLYKQQELSYAEIAEVLGSSESAVKTWIFRGRQTLRELLRDLL